MSKRKNRKKAVHHLCPVSNEEKGFVVWQPMNTKEVRVDKHVHFHGYFKDHLPHEQIQQLLELNYTVIKKDIRKLIRDLCALDYSDFYKKDIISEGREVDREEIDDKRREVVDRINKVLNRIQGDGRFKQNDND